MFARPTSSPTRQKSDADEAAEAAAAAVWRFLSGAPMDGIQKTDATWTHRGVRSTRPDGRRASTWDHLARWERAGVRWTTLASAAATAYGYTQDATATLTGLEASGLTATSAGTAYVAYRAADGLVTWRHRHAWVWPLHLVLSRVLELPEGTKPRHYLHVPSNFTEISGDVIRIDIPAYTIPDDMLKSQVKALVMSKLALQDVTFSWNLASTNHYVTVTQSPRPPSKVLFSDPAVQALVEKAPESAPLIGLSHRGTVVSVDLDAESPHVLVSAGTGGGKSVILRAIYSQALHNGGNGFVLDRKRHSHKWARGIPGSTYCREIEDIHDALVRLGNEGDRRNRIVDDWEGDDTLAPVGPRMMILLEEVNATIRKLKSFWAEIRDPKTDPKESPAIAALGEILFMGRAVKMHVLAVGQSITANAIGGPEMRENFATRILARYSRNAWNMLVPEVQPAPKATKHIGRAQVVLGGNARETQVVFFTDAEARDWAMRRPPVAASQGHNGASHLGQTPVTVTDPSVTGQPEAPEAEGGKPFIPGQRLSEDDFVKRMEAAFAGPDAVEPQRETPVTLRQAVDGGILTCSLAVARKEANDPKRNKEFPASIGIQAKTKAKLYLPSDLQRWERNRPKSGAKPEPEDA
jgi:hypothetical protein